MKLKEILNENTVMTKEMLNIKLERIGEKYLDMYKEDPDNAQELICDFVFETFGIFLPEDHFQDVVGREYGEDGQGTPSDYILNAVTPFCEQIHDVLFSIKVSSFKELSYIGSLWRDEDTPITYDDNLDDEYFVMALTMGQVAPTTLKQFLKEEADNVNDDALEEIEKFQNIIKKHKNLVFLGWGIEYDNNISAFLRN